MEQIANVTLRQNLGMVDGGREELVEVKPSVAVQVSLLEDSVPLTAHSELSVLLEDLLCLLDFVDSDHTVIVLVNLLEYNSKHFEVHLVGLEARQYGHDRLLELV